jgi:hypothetical protein
MKKYLLYIFLVAVPAVCVTGSYAQSGDPESVQPQSVADVLRVTINPNPVHGNTFFYIQIDSCKTRSLNSLILYNSNGYVMQNKTIQLQEGDNRFLVNIAGFNPGFYIVQLVGRNIPNYSVSRQIMVDQ